MFFRTVVVLGLVAYAQASRYQRPRRQVPGYGGGQYSNSTSSSSTSISDYTTSTTTTVTLSASPSSVSSATSSSSSVESPYTSSASSISTAYGYSIPSTSTLGASSEYTSINTSSASPISSYGSSGEVSTSTTVSTYVTVSTTLTASSYIPTTFPFIPGTGASSYQPSSVISPLPSGPTAYSRSSSPSFPSASSSSWYGPSPVGPGTAYSPSSSASSSEASTISPSQYSPTTFPYAPSGTGPSSYSPPVVLPKPSGYSVPGPQRPPGTAPFYGPSPVGPETSLWPKPTGYSGSSTATNVTCGGAATLNVLGASLDWWYTETYTYAVSTFSVLLNNNDSATGWTLLPASTTFDVSSAVAAPSCTYSVVNATNGNSTYSYYDGTCYPTPAPVAASTTVVSVAAYTNLNQTTGDGTIPNVVTTPPPAVVTVPSSAGSFSAGTPFVYFSAYEIMSKYPTTYKGGREGCAETTTIFNMSTPFSFEYTGDMQLDGLLEVNAGVTGDVNPALLGVVGQTVDVVAGSWVAAPTVVVVVEKVLAAEANAATSITATPAAVTQTVLQTITPTLPPGFQTQGASGGSLTGLPVTIRVESTQPVLLLPTSATTTAGSPTSAKTTAGSPPEGSTAVHESSEGGNTGGAGTTTAIHESSEGGDSGGSGTTTVPFVAQQGSSKVTLEVAVPSTEQTVTANFNGATVTATRAPAEPQNTGEGGAAPASGLGNLVSAINSAAQPTNALQVLSEAQGQVGNPTGGAIVAGLGGSSNQGGGGGTPAQVSGSNGGSSGSTQNNGGSGSSPPGSGFGSSSGSSSGQQVAAPAPVITVAGSTITANPTPAFVVDGQTALPGGSPITVGGDTIAIPASTNAIVIDGSTIPLAGGISSSTVFDINGIPITANPAAAFPIAGQTLEAGGPAITVDGTTLSLLPGGTAVVVDGKTSQISQQTPGAAANIPLLTVGSNTFTANAATQFSLGPGATLTPGGVVTISGSTISLDSGATAVVINGHTETLGSPAITPAPLVTVGGTVYQANAGSTYDIGGSLLTPGGVITVSGTTISLGSGASDIVINGQTTALNLPAILNGASSQTAPSSNYATITAPPVLTVDGQAFDANGGTSYIISGKTLTPGGAITITGPNGVETISLNSAANELFSIVSGTTMTSMIGAMGAMATGAPVLTIDGQTYSAVSYDTGSGPTYVVDGQTLTRGGQITITEPNGSLETISLEAAGHAIEIISDGHTSTSTIAGALAVMPTAAPVLTIDGEKFTAINNGATYIIDGKTLTPGEIETVTISGKTFVISLAPGATILEIETEGPNGILTGTMFETLFPAQMTRGTVTNTMHGATAGAHLTSGGAKVTGAGGSNANLQSGAPSLPLAVSGIVMAVGSLVLAVWL